MMETTQLKEEINKLRMEMEGILTELQTLMDAKLSLELEIAAYRKLLEGEENRSVKTKTSFGFGVIDDSNIPDKENPKDAPESDKSAKDKDEK